MLVVAEVRPYACVLFEIGWYLHYVVAVTLVVGCSCWVWGAVGESFCMALDVVARSLDVWSWLLG